MLNLGLFPHFNMLSFIESFCHLFLQTKDTYKVIVRIKDMNGQDNCLSNTGTATITLADINDNLPTFTKPSVSY